MENKDIILENEIEETEEFVLAVPDTEEVYEEVEEDVK